MVWTNLVVKQYQIYLNSQRCITPVAIVTAAIVLLCFIPSPK